MKTESSLFFGELKESWIKQWFIVLFLFVILLSMAQVGFIKYKNEKKEIESTSKIESIRAEQFKRITPYGVYGIRLSSMPSPLFFLSSFRAYDTLTSFMNSGPDLKIYENKRNDRMTPDATIGYLNYSGFFLLLFCSLAFYNGHQSSKCTKFVYFMHNIRYSHKSNFILILSRIFFQTLILFLILGATIILAYFNSISIVTRYYLSYSYLAVIVMIVFFILGFIAGASKRKGKLTALFLAILFFIAPIYLTIINHDLSKFVSTTETSFNKLKIFLAFERLGLRKYGKLRSGEKVNKFISDYLNNDMKIIDRMEDNLLKEIKEKFERYRILSTLIPSTFFLASASEISGNGNTTAEDFYDFSQQMKRNFIEHYANIKYFSKKKQDNEEPNKLPTHVESFIKGDSNIFYSEPSLHKYHGTGTLVTLLYIVLFGFIAYRLYLRKLLPPGTTKPLEDFTLFMHNRETNYLFTADEVLKTRFLNNLGDRKNKINALCMRNGEIDSDFEVSDYFYLPNVSHFEGIRPATLHRFLLGEGMKTKLDIKQVLLKYAKTRHFVVLDEFFRDMPANDVWDTIRELDEIEENFYYLVISSDYFLTKETADKYPKINLFKDDPTSARIRFDKENPGKI